MVKASDFVFDASEIIAHMFFSTGTTDKVRVTHNAGEFSGCFRYPISDAVDIVCATDEEGLEPGEPVYISYAGAGDQYRFHSEVVSLRGEVLRVRFPVAMERSDRRLTVRVPIPEEMSAELLIKGKRGQRRFRVRDLSDGGLSCIWPMDEPVELGDLIPSALYLESERPFQFKLEVRHQNPRGSDMVVGGRMADITLQERGRLSRFIVERLILSADAGRG